MLASTTNRIVYTGNGSVSAYSITFDIFDDSHIVVLEEVIATGVVTTYTITTDYTINAALDTLTLVAGNLPSTKRIIILRTVPLTQLTDIRNQGSFLPETHEETFDYLTMIDQQQQREIDLSIRLSDADYAFDSELPRTEAEGVLAVNADNDGFEFISIEEIGAAANAPTLNGSTVSPRTIADAVGITSATGHMNVASLINIVFVQGDSAGESIITANPQIDDPTTSGSQMFIIGANNVSYITLNDGNNLKLNGPWSSNDDNTLHLLADGTNWVEISRRN